MAMVGVASIGLCIWTIVDAARRPDYVFEASGQNKMTWIVLAAVGVTTCQLMGLVVAIIYLTSVRKKLDAAPVPAGWPGYPPTVGYPGRFGGSPPGYPPGHPPSGYPLSGYPPSGFAPPASVPSDHPPSAGPTVPGPEPVPSRPADQPDAVDATERPESARGHGERDEDRSVPD